MWSPARCWAWPGSRCPDRDGLEPALHQGFRHHPRPGQPTAWIRTYIRSQVPDSLVARRQEVVNKLRTLEGQVKTITDFLSNADNVRLLKQDKTQNQAFLQSEFGIGKRAQGCILDRGNAGCCPLTQ